MAHRVQFGRLTVAKAEELTGIVQQRVSK